MNEKQEMISKLANGNPSEVYIIFEKLGFNTTPDLVSAFMAHRETIRDLKTLGIDSTDWIDFNFNKLQEIQQEIN